MWSRQSNSAWSRSESKGSGHHTHCECSQCNNVSWWPTPCQPIKILLRHWAFDLALADETRKHECCYFGLCEGSTTPIRLVRAEISVPLPPWFQHFVICISIGKYCVITGLGMDDLTIHITVLFHTITHKMLLSLSFQAEIP